MIIIFENVKLITRPELQDPTGQFCYPASFYYYKYQDNDEISLSGLKSSASDSNSSSSQSSRRSSSSSNDGSRKSSLKSNLQRKFGSTSEENSFVANLDEELRRKLDSIGKDDNKEEVKTAPVVTAQLQAERAARICDIIVEEREK